MAKKPNENEILYCSFCGKCFCGKSQHEVLKLIAGPNVQICNCCTDLCIDIVLEEIQEAGELEDLKDMPRLSSLSYSLVVLRKTEKGCGNTSLLAYLYNILQ